MHPRQDFNKAHLGVEFSFDYGIFATLLEEFEAGIPGILRNIFREVHRSHLIDEDGCTDCQSVRDEGSRF